MESVTDTYLLIKCQFSILMSVFMDLKLCFIDLLMRAQKNRTNNFQFLVMQTLQQFNTAVSSSTFLIVSV